MLALPREGKSIADIQQQDFPQYEYSEVYWTVKLGGEIGSRGAKYKITKRLNKLVSAPENKREELVTEIKELVWYLYSRHKENQKKLDEIRKIIGE